jgi:hypothetical protein
MHFVAGLALAIAMLKHIPVVDCILLGAALTTSIISLKEKE